MAFSKQETQRKPAATNAECESSQRCMFRRMYGVSVTVWHLPPWRILVGITAVPLVLLGLGAAGYWVARGFNLTASEIDSEFVQHVVGEAKSLYQMLGEVR